MPYGIFIIEKAGWPDLQRRELGLEMETKMIGDKKPKLNKAYAARALRLIRKGEGASKGASLHYIKK